MCENRRKMFCQAGRGTFTFNSRTLMNREHLNTTPELLQDERLGLTNYKQTELFFYKRCLNLNSSSSAIKEPRRGNKRVF